MNTEVVNAEQLVSVLRETSTDDRKLRFVTASEFAAVEEPASEPLAVDAESGAVIPADALVLVYGDGGAGKTTLVLDLVVHMATGTPWLDLISPRRALRIALVENEGPRAMFRQKLARKIDAWPKAGDQILVLEEPWQGVSFRDDTQRDELVRLIDEEEIDILVAAPLSRLGMRGGGTLDEIAEFVELIADVQTRCKQALTVLLLHHQNRAGQISGAWEGIPDTLVHVSAQGHGRTRIFWQKLRWSSFLHGTTTHLLWAEDESFIVEERQEITEETIADGIVAAVRDNPGCSWSQLRPLVRGNDGEKATVRERLLSDRVLVNTAAREGHFNLWVADDPATPRAELSTGLARRSEPTPAGEPEAVRATVPYVSRHGARHGTDEPGSNLFGTDAP